jgi:chemotaxis methyl-accepting protein methylase
MNRSVVAAAARLLASQAGLHVPEGLRERLSTCLQREARAGGQPVEGYLASLAGDPAAFQRLLDCITVQETDFFRHPDHFATLRLAVLPTLQPPVTVWSAGCANGQEAYSLAMLLAESGCPDWQVLATDLSSEAVARTRAGRYSRAELAGLPPACWRFVRPAGDGFEVEPELRRRVRAERANLVEGDFPCPAGRCQVVFCRNVLIYLTRAEVAAFLERLAGWLAPGGVLFLGYSESVSALASRLRPERLGGTFVLRAPGPAPAVGRPAPPAARPARPTGAPLPDAAELLATGEAAHRGGDPHSAIAAFRKAAYLDPDQPLAHFHLGLALEAAGDDRAARRAFAAALAALERCDPAGLEARLEGWHRSELAATLQARLGAGAGGRR